MATEGAPQPSTLSLTEVRGNLREVVDGIVRTGGEVIITRRGKPLAALIAFDDYESLIETVDILSDDDTMAAIAEGEADFGAGKRLALHRAARRVVPRSRGSAGGQEGRCVK